MEIIDLKLDHLDQAKTIAMSNYEEERLSIPILPQIQELPDLKHFADNQLGVAAFEGDQMLGFLGAYLPHEDVFGTTGVRGTFSPVHAHGVIAADPMKGSLGYNLNRERIFSLLYQAAAKKWVKEGIRSHAIGLYTYDKEAIQSFFYNGFGLRCIDAIRSLDDAVNPKDLTTEKSLKIEYCELNKEDWRHLLDHHNGLITHLGDSPTFMKFNLFTEDELYNRTNENTRYFVAKEQDKYIAYIKIDTEGENYITMDRGMMNICGAYCIPIYRGSGVYHNLLSYLVTVLKSEGYRLLGVDCESFNPTARGFWLKYFTEYTHSVVRRIDERAVDL